MRFKDAIPEGDITGPCVNQTNKELYKKACRYGKCEIVNDGTDFLCHCDYVCFYLFFSNLIILNYFVFYLKHITGRKCDLPVPLAKQSDACASNPCWGESICISLTEDIDGFKCICFGKSRGKYCQRTSETPPVSNEIIDVNNYDENILSNYANNEFEMDTNEAKSSTVTLKTYIPTVATVELCNYSTCQLGKCLENGTCQCIEPAFGKYCEQINECLFVSCVHVSCVLVGFKRVFCFFIY